MNDSYRQYIFRVGKLSLGLHLTEMTHLLFLDLRKQFKRNPFPVEAEVDGTVELQCLPPHGQPLPDVFWLKDREEIDVSTEPSLIISSEGSLIISQVCVVLYRLTPHRV